MTRCIAAFVLFTLLSVSSTFAQAPPQPPAPPEQPRQGRPAPAPPAPPAAPAAPAAAAAPAAVPAPVRRQGQALNVKVDVTVTDQRSGTAPVRKTVSVTTADAQNSFIRTQAEYIGLGPVPLNVDVQPTLLPGGRIMLGLNLQYDLPALPAPDDKTPSTAVRLTRTTVRENLSLVLDSGKPVIAAQSADPVGDRQVTVEVTATVLK